MKRNELIFVIISILVIIAWIILYSILFGKSRQYTSFFTDETVTTWNDCVVFGKYDGRLAPKDNYIKFKKQKGYDVRVFFKSDNTVTIWSKLNAPVKTGFDENKYDVKIYYGTDNLQKYYDECQYSDSLAVKEYTFTKKLYLGHEIKMSEITTDYVYVSIYYITWHKSISRKTRCIFPRDYEGFKR